MRWLDCFACLALYLALIFAAPDDVQAWMDAREYDPDDHSDDEEDTSNDSGH